jgi:predicted transcriptional regulator
MSNQDTVDAIKLMIVGSLLAEYGSRLMVDDTKRDLKYRVKCVINAVKNVEMHFINHNNTTNEFREQFKRAFNKNETVLLADLNLICWQIGEDGLEEIIRAVKQAVEEPPKTV